MFYHILYYPFKEIMSKSLKILLLLSIIYAFSCLQPLDPLFSYYSEIQETMERNLDVNEYIIRFLLPSYKENSYKPSNKPHSNISPINDSERILSDSNKSCGAGKLVNITQIHYRCHNNTVTREVFNGNNLSTKIIIYHHHIYKKLCLISQMTIIYPLIH